MQVSVVIPTYNRAQFICEAVESVLVQTFGDLELIVVDDGSTDGSSEMMHERFGADERLTVVVQENLGVSAARNRGASLARGEYLAFLDSDDYWKPEKLERQLAWMRERSGYKASYTEEVWYRRGKWANPKKAHAKHSGCIFERCLPLCIISPSSIMMETSLYRELGGFDESLAACEDYDLWLRLSARHPVLLVEEPLIIKRNGHEGQLSQVHWGLDRLRIRGLWKIVYDETHDDDVRRPTLEEIVKKAKVVANGARKRGHETRAQVFEHSAEEAGAWLTSLPAG